MNSRASFANFFMPMIRPPMLNSISFPVVDIHNHVIAGDPSRFPQAPMGGKQSDWSRERPVNDLAMLDAMRDAGVAKSVLVQASTCYGHDNRYVAACVKAHPAHFLGVFSVDLLATDALHQIHHWTQLGLSGLRIFIAGHTTADKSIRLDNPASFPAWEYITEHRIPISVQLRSDGLGQLEVLLSRFPDALVLLDHFARPDIDDGAPYLKARPLFALARHANLHFKFTTHNVRESKQGKATQASFCKALADNFGVHRIAWGSNFPASSGTLRQLLQEAIEATDTLTTQEQEWIYSRTAHSLYPTLGAMKQGSPTSLSEGV
jgi:L-fuconolactonase